MSNEVEFKEQPLQYLKRCDKDHSPIFVTADVGFEDQPITSEDLKIISVKTRSDFIPEVAPDRSTIRLNKFLWLAFPKDLKSSIEVIDNVNRRVDRNTATKLQRIANSILGLFGKKHEFIK